MFKQWRQLPSLLLHNLIHITGFDIVLHHHNNDNCLCPAFNDVKKFYFTADINDEQECFYCGASECDC